MNKHSEAGFSLIELLIVVVIIGIIAAVAIPNLLAARRSANEGAAISALRTVHGAQNTYSATSGNGDYAGTPWGLDGVGLSTLASLSLVDNALGSGTKSGYVYQTGTTSKSASVAATFCTRAVPTSWSGITSTGTRCFGIATNGVVMTNVANAANCGCSINAGAQFVDRSSPLSQ